MLGVQSRKERIDVEPARRIGRRCTCETVHEASSVDVFFAVSSTGFFSSLFFSSGSLCATALASTSWIRYDPVLPAPSICPSFASNSFASRRSLLQLAIALSDLI